MNKQLKEKLINEYRKVFINTFEAGGGYGFRYYHGLRTMKYCEQFLKLPYFKNKAINKDAAVIAALFADIGKVKAINKKGELVYGSRGDQEHAEAGAKIISKYLSKYIKNKGLINLIVYIINEQHNKEQSTIEAKLVKDADRLDNYGFIQIWRHITYAHYDRRGIDRLKEFWIDEKARENAKNYLKKFNFPIIKKLAKVRYRKLNYLISEIDKESQGKDIK